MIGIFIDEDFEHVRPNSCLSITSLKFFTVS